MTDPNHDEDLAAFMARAAAAPRRGPRPPPLPPQHDHDACHRELERLRAAVAALGSRLDRLERERAEHAALPTVAAPPTRPGHAPSCLCAVCRADLQRALLAARRS